MSLIMLYLSSYKFCSKYLVFGKPHTMDTCYREETDTFAHLESLISSQSMKFGKWLNENGCSALGKTTCYKRHMHNFHASESPCFVSISFVVLFLCLEWKVNPQMPIHIHIYMYIYIYNFSCIVVLYTVKLSLIMLYLSS